MKINRISCILICGAISNPVSAASNWKVNAGVAANLSFNDNITRVSSGTKVDGVITQINPYIGVSGKSKRIDLDLKYNMQNLFYSNNSQYNDTFHQFQGDMKANLVKNFLFIDTGAAYAQQNISNTTGTFFNNTTVTGNRTNVGRARVKPYIKHNFGRTAQLTTGAEYSVVRYGTSGLLDNNISQYDFTLNSGKDFNRMTWQVDYLKMKIKPDTQSDIIFEQYNGLLGYKLTRKITVTASAGREKNRFARAAVTSIPEGLKWMVGVKWTPTKMTTVDAGAGRRFFGNSGFLTVTTSSRLTKTSIRYSEDLSTSSTSQFGRRIYTGTNSNPSNPNVVDISQPSIRAGTYIRKQLRGDFSIKSAKSVLSLSAYNESRDYQVTNNTERVYGGSVNFNWNFAQRTRAILSATGAIINPALSGKVGLMTLNVSVNRQLRKKLSANISVSHSRRKSGQSASDYKQNIANVGINWRF